MQDNIGQDALFYLQYFLLKSFSVASVNCVLILNCFIVNKVATEKESGIP